MTHKYVKTEVFMGSHLSKFYDDMLKGNQIKELVKVLLEKSGYLVLPYGYESTLSDIKRKLNARDARNSRTARRLRSTPDLLVYDDKRKDAMLVEVKMRNAPKETKILIYPKLVRRIKQFWSDCLLVIVIPSGDVFYAQRITEFETKEAYNATKDFEKFEHIFTRVKAENLSSYRDEALKIMKK